MTIEEAAKVRGALYLPARAFNAYQMWKDYDRAAIERDLSFAAKLKLNALRVFLNYDYWLEDRSRLENNVYHLCQSASAHKIRIMPVLFDCRGSEPTEEARDDRDPKRAGDMRSPRSELVNDQSKWFSIEEYVNWFFQRWAYEHRMLAVEVINEPATVMEFKFGRTMFARAARHRKLLPLTFGARELEDSRLMQDLGLDILQIHLEASSSEVELRDSLERAQQTQQILARPVIVITPVVLQSCALGGFISSLMIRPGDDGVIGVFHENGAVWNLADARAISGDEDFSAEERKTKPSWM